MSKKDEEGKETGVENVKGRTKLQELGCGRGERKARYENEEEIEYRPWKKEPHA